MFQSSGLSSSSVNLLLCLILTGLLFFMLIVLFSFLATRSITGNKMSDVEQLVKPDDDRESVILTTYNDNNQMNNDNSDYSGRKYWDRVRQLGGRLRRLFTDDYIDIQ